MADKTSAIGSKVHQYYQRRDLRVIPKGVQRARSKAPEAQNAFNHLEPKETEDSPLLKRFFSLPPEIRNIIYRQLLVQPCKFNLRHERCKVQLVCTRPGPSDYRSYRADGPQCANCHHNNWNMEAQIEIFKSPARSQWTTPQSNEYLCDNCYWDLNGRIERRPCMRSLPCLCARRKNLALLLVSKRFWKEAAPVFWTENWFAFEHPCLLIGFLSTIRPQVRSWLRRISFMPIHGYRNNDFPSSFAQWREPLWDGWDDIKSCWYLLRQCGGLMELELDAVLLTRQEWALSIRLIHVKKRVTFFRYMNVGELDDGPVDPSVFIWALHARRKPVDSTTTALLVDSMTGTRCIKRKTLIHHYAGNDLYQRCGEYGVEFTERMIEGRRWNS